VSIADNAAGTPQTVSLTGTGQDYSVTATAPAAITPGQSASIPVTVIGLGGYTGSVSFACSGSIPGGSCVAPAAVNAAPAPGATATFMITTTAFVAPPPSRRIPPVSPRQIVLLLAPGSDAPEPRGSCAAIHCAGRLRGHASYTDAGGSLQL
jgi:hypothetical protein